MRKLLLALFLGTSLLVTGCPASLQIHPDKEGIEKSRVEKAQDAIDQANAGIVSVGRTILKYYKAGAYDKARKDSYTEELTNARNGIKEAQKWLEDGNISQAELISKLAEEGIDRLREELVKYATKENK